MLNHINELRCNPARSPSFQPGIRDLLEVCRSEPWMLGCSPAFRIKAHLKEERHVTGAGLILKPGSALESPVAAARRTFGASGI